jgi:hypothetical protein
MRKLAPRKPSAQIDLPFGDEPKSQKEFPKTEMEPAPFKKETQLTAKPGDLDKYVQILREDNDKDEDPRAQTAREWKGYWAGRGGGRRRA